MIETNQLISLITIDQYGSFSKAAEKLNVTQSAISQSIKNLEKKLGFSLVVRDKKEVFLTPEGKKLSRLGNKYIRSYEELIQSFHENRERMVGPYGVGTLDGIGKSFLSDFFLEFSENYPLVQLKILLETPENLLRKFKERELQALILPEYQIPGNLERLPIFDEYLCLVAHPELLGELGEENLGLEDLKKLPLLFFEDQDPNFFRWCRDHYGQTVKGFEPRLVFNSYSSLLHGISNKLGLAVLPSHIVERDYFKRESSKLFIGKKTFLNKICFAFSEDNQDDLKTQKILEYFRGQGLSE